MVYMSEGTKWKAYQFSDPFAARSFYVCNKINKFFCRPDCDARPVTNLKSEIKFVDLVSEAINYGYVACESCDPLSTPAIDVDMLVDCVATINRLIGFLPPLLDENEERNNEKIKKNIIESKKTNEEQILQAIGGRRSSVPVINFDGKYSKDFENTSLSKNDFDHYRLVDLACRHLALAAAVNIFQPQSSKGSRSSESSPSNSNSSSSSRKRRRRGGVLGFKELAAKSKLSAWHFHRVFKSVTGLTPKTYGDKCWEHIKTHMNSKDYPSYQQSRSQLSNDYQTPLTNMSESSPSIPTSPNGSSDKRIKLEPQEKVTFDITPPQTSQPTFKERLILPNQVPMTNQDSKFSSNLITPPPLGSEDSNKINPLKYSVPQQDTFDVNINQELSNNNFNMFNENTANSSPDLSQGLSTRAFSAPNLAQYNTRPSTLFSHLKSNEKSPLEEYNSTKSSDSPIIGDVPSTIDEVEPASQYMKEPESNTELMNDVPELNSLLCDTGVNSLNPLNDVGNNNLDLNLNNNYFDFDQSNQFNLGFASDLLSTNNNL